MPCNISSYKNVTRCFPGFSRDNGKISLPLQQGWSESLEVSGSCATIVGENVFSSNSHESIISISMSSEQLNGTKP